jgi:putative PIN family toxin of toxin-antitoxin system
MLRVVIDTNVIISALNFGGRPKDVLEMARKNLVRNLTSAFILHEVKHVLTGKFAWPPEIAMEVIQALQEVSELIEPLETLSVISYLPDNRILECAVEGQADFIISGDHHLTGLKIYKNITISTPAAFLAAFRQK